MIALDQMEKYQAKLDELKALCHQRYGKPLPPIELKLDLKGRSGGIAVCGSSYKIRLNPQIAEQNLLNEILPHELAHIAAHYYRLGKNHDQGWRACCIELGGTGERCHTYNVAPSRTQKRYQYTTSTNNDVVITATRHNKIQEKGMIYKYKDGGLINKHSKWTAL